MNTLSVTPHSSIDQNTDIASLDRDGLLQASRRVDWRFLLPQPDLSETAYIGLTDTELIASLRRFCTSLTVLPDAQADGTRRSHFSLVVASNPNESELCQAARAACPGGYVYVEVCRCGVERSTPSSHRNPMGGVNQYLAVMNQLALSGLQAHWHWPNFESCSEIIPLHDRAAGICALRRRGSGAGSRWKTGLARLLLESNLLARFVPCFSVLGRRQS